VLRAIEHEEKQQEEARPLLFVDINLGEDQIERIVVFEGDTAGELAREFSQKHGLDLETQLKLRDLIDQQIQNVIASQPQSPDDPNNL
jgi:hypothetical protein